MLAEFFESLDSALRLLRLKRSKSTFTNICPKIECLTDRYLFCCVVACAFALCCFLFSR